MTTPIHIVWFKRDLRIADHAPLALACQSGAVLPVFVWDSDLWRAEDYSVQHQMFAKECLQTLKQDLTSIGLSLLESPIGIVDTLNHLRQQTQIAAIWSHEETGNAITYAIDKAVSAWCTVHGVIWHQIAQHGVVRRLKNRNHWNALWEQRMNESQACLPVQIVAASIAGLQKNSIEIMSARGVDKPKRQRGGREAGLNIFNHFLQGRAAHYRRGISSPLSAVRSCSRLSPYLTWGVLSMREVVQATRLRRIELKEMGNAAPVSLASGLTSFESRLHWHCHFIQKLESEPALEFNNMHSAHNGLRDQYLADTEQKSRLATWARGETGWPLVDACMAMLRTTGWVNFRMRAMLMSSASYLYWLHWREPGLHLAREFLDYEPGIHWPQTQMQSGTTGINTLRIYNPIKQAKDHDPTGKFVRYWLPQLANVPDTWIFQPWLMPKAQQLLYGCVLDKNYPMPLVDAEKAAFEAKTKLIAARQAYDGEAYAAQTQAIIKKHASRKGMPGRQRDASQCEQKAIKNKGLNKKSSQLDLF